MANNRMFLLHRPSGRALFLGKRMLHGWYHTHLDTMADDLKWLLESAGDDPDTQDDFMLVMEDCDAAPFAYEDFAYDSKSGEPLRLKLTDEPKFRKPETV